MKPYYDDGNGIQIFHGDCLEVLPTLKRGSVRLLWADPPYGHGNQNGDLQSARVRDNVRGARKREPVAIANDAQEDMRETVDAALLLCEPLLNPECCCCAGGGGPNVTFAWLANRLDSGGLQFFHAVIWDKSGRWHGLGWRFRRDYEFVMVATKKGGRLAWVSADSAVPNILFIQPTGNDLHPTEKPVELVSWFAELTTSEDDLILDPFMGSGTTLRAAKDLGRKAIGIEIEERYCEIAAKRLAQEVFAFTD